MAKCASVDGLKDEPRILSVLKIRPEIKLELVKTSAMVLKVVNEHVTVPIMVLKRMMGATR